MPYVVMLCDYAHVLCYEEYRTPTQMNSLTYTFVLVAISCVSPVRIYISVVLCFGFNAHS